ncbi:MAG: right-handed parallel beta-helix repeat-containing protein, partial [Candidatus Thermoplasmatota archaeon]|nr:right-handed parallel beta-helix repeat-containing protein [Candidatus Thermoplasmatota archaeon]
MPSPVLVTSPQQIRTESGFLEIQDTVERYTLEHRYTQGKDVLHYEIIIPREILSNSVNYPLFIDPSITTFDGYAVYQGYSNGSISYWDGDGYTWYYDVDRTIYLDSDITIGTGETLLFKNVIVKANTVNTKLEVEDGGALYITDGTKFTKTGNCDGYTIVYGLGSVGGISNCTIEKAKYQRGIEICSSDVSVLNSTISDGNEFGIYVNQALPLIFNCSIHHHDVGIYASPFANPMIVGNHVNDTGIGIKVDSANIFEDFDTSESIEKLIGTEIVDSRIIYDTGYQNYALTCPSVQVDSTYQPMYCKERMYDGVTSSEWWNQWNSYVGEPHYAVFDFEEEVNLTHFIVHHRSDFLTFDYQVQTWTGSNWYSQFNINDNTEPVRIHNLGSVVSTQKVRLYVTDSNYNQDTIARIREFEIFGESDDPGCHYYLSGPINVYGGSIFGSLVLDKVEPGNSSIHVSILDGETNLTIDGFDQLMSDTINLRWINTTAHPSIKIKAEFQVSGSDEPALDGYCLYYSSYRSLDCEFDSVSDVVYADDIEIGNGYANLNSTNVTWNEQWDDDWDDNWTVEETYDGGEYYTIEDHWTGSGSDLYIEGTSLIPSSGHDGNVIVYKYFGEVDPNCTVQTHFEGQIDSSIYNMADISIILRDETNSSFKEIRWTTRDYSYNGGVSGNTYYIVAQEHDTITPFENEETIHSKIFDLFEEKFGSGAIDWNTYRYLEFRSRAWENYNQRQNPKIYIDYFIVGNISKYGYGYTRILEKNTNTTWAYLAVDKDLTDVQDVRISILDGSTGEVVGPYSSIVDNITDISTLNDMGVECIQIHFEIYYSSIPARIDWIKVFTTPRFEYNRIDLNEIGILSNDSLPMVRYCDVTSNSNTGIRLWENRSKVASDNYLPHILYSNHIDENYIGLFIENTTCHVDRTDLSGNEITFQIQNSTMDISDSRVNDNHKRMFINDSVVYFDNVIFNDSVLNLFSSQSYITFDRISSFQNINRYMELMNTKVCFLDNECYLNITFELIEGSIVYGNWSISLSVSDRNGSSCPDLPVRFYDSDYNIVNTVYTDEDGMIASQLTERKKENNDWYYMTPHRTVIDDRNDFYLNMIAPLSYSVVYGYDSDGDLIGDIAEKEQGKYLFECEYLVEPSKVNDSGAFKQLWDSNIVPVDIYLSGPTPTEYLYSLALRAKYFDGASDQKVSINFTGNVSSSCDETYDLTPFYSWYQTNWFTVTSHHIEGYLDDVNGPGQVVVDKYLLLRKDGNVENPPVIGTPLISDIDQDDLLDGYERTHSGFYVEAEHYTQTPCTEINDPAAVNSKYVINGNNHDAFVVVPVRITSDNSGEYKVYIRAKDEGGQDPGRFEIRISGGTSQFSEILSEVFEWYEFKFILDQMGLNLMLITADITGTSVGIDRLVFIKNDEVFITTITGSSSPYSIEDVPVWGHASSARITFESICTQRTFTNPDHGNDLDLDTYDNMTVFSTGGNTYGYNLSTDREYDIEIDPVIISSSPTTSMGEMVFHDDAGNYNGGNIYYTDLRKGPGNLEPVKISTINGMDHFGLCPKISDGNVLWISENDGGITERKLYVRSMDSMHLIEIEEPATPEIIGPASIYTRTAVWISSEIDGGTTYNYIRMANLGILADVQEDEPDNADLAPHIMTVDTTTLNFEQVDIYGTRIVYIEGDQNGYWIMLYDHETRSISQVYPQSGSSLSICGDRPIYIWGGHICWEEHFGATYIVKIIELGQTTPITAACVWNNDLDSYSLFGGQVYYSEYNDHQIKGYCNDQDLRVDTYPFYHSSDLAQSTHTTYDLSEELNEYLRDAQFDPAYTGSIEDDIDVPIIIDGLGGALTIRGVEIRIDNVTDPFTYDMDGDGLSDGYELLNYFNESLLETEDTFDFEEWIEPACADPHQTWSQLAGATYRYSPMFYVEGVDLITGDYQYGKDGEENPLWVNTSSYIEYPLSEVSPGNVYRISSVKNQRMNDAYSDLDDLDLGNMMPSMDVRASEGDAFGSTGPENLYSECYRLNDTEEQYINDVLNSVIIFNYSGTSDEPVEVQWETRSYNILWCSIGKIVDTPAGYYNDELCNDIMMLAIEMDYVGQVNFGGSRGYKLEIRSDLDLLPDDLNPLLRSELGTESNVPDGFPVDRFHFIRLANLDRIVISNLSLDPMDRDTDGDLLLDWQELMPANNSFPLSDDPDRDAISDHDEVVLYSTSATDRDTDGDSIRDCVELSLYVTGSPNEYSIGSWFERKARNDDYFDLNLIFNEDADHGDSTDPLEPDTDGDGLPDGWIDGWYYFGEYNLGFWGSYYSSEHWRGGLDYDCMLQVWEGEDINLNGKMDGVMGSWDFDGITFEFKGSGTGECNAGVPDTDLDGLPDGYEVWYATREPFIGPDSDLIISPRNYSDRYVDLDPSGHFMMVAFGAKEDQFRSINAVGTMIAQEIDFDPNELKKVVRVEVMVATGDEVKCIEIWSGDGSKPQSKLHTVHGYAEKTEGPSITSFAFDVPEGYFYNGLAPMYGCSFFIVIPYTGQDIHWAEAMVDSSLTYSYSTVTDTWTGTDYDVVYALYNHSYSGDGLNNLEEYIVGTHPKNRNTDVDKFGDHDDGLTDGEEVVPFHPGDKNVLARTNIEDGALKFDTMYDGARTATYMYYIDDPLDPFSPTTFHQYDYYDKGETYTFTSWEYVHVFLLRDGSIVTHVT